MSIKSYSGMPPANDLVWSHAKTESILQQIKDDPRESFHIYQIYTYTTIALFPRDENAPPLHPILSQYSMVNCEYEET